MSYEPTNEAFLSMESELGLFDREVDGVRFWERVRFEVNKRIHEATGTLDAPRAETATRSRLARLRELVAGITVRNPYLAGDVDVVVFGHPNRERRGDGLAWNRHCDPVVDRLDLPWVVLEGCHRGGHDRPAKTENLRYLDALEYGFRLRRRLSGPDPFAPENGSIEEISEAIQSRFGVDVDVPGMVRRDLSLRRHRLPVYLDLLGRLDPDLVVLTVSYGYGMATQIEACKRLGIPTAELQHGVIDPHHFGYSYPGDRTKHTFPDHLLVYGAFWRDAVEYPIPDRRVHPVGYPFLELQRSGLETADGPPAVGSSGTVSGRGSADTILFVSQGAIGDRLSRFAADLAAEESYDADVVYKLHPAELERFPEEYPWLAAADLRVEDGFDASLYELFEAADAQVGVYSTAIYEGLSFDLRTYLADLPGVVKLRPLLETDAARIVESVDELIAAERTEDWRPDFDRARFFAPDALEAVPRTLERLCGTDPHEVHV